LEIPRRIRNLRYQRDSWYSVVGTALHLAPNLRRISADTGRSALHLAPNLRRISADIKMRAATLAALSAAALASALPAPPPLKPLASWPLPTAHGNITHTDHLYISGATLYLSAKNVDRVFALSLATGAVLHAVDVHAPQGLGVLGGRLWVGSDEIGILSAFDLATLKLDRALNFSNAPDAGEADNIVVDAATGSVLCAVGDDGPGSADPAEIVTVDAATFAVTATVATPEHVEGFAIVAGGDFILANSPGDTDSAVLLIARANSTVVRSWPLAKGVAGNGPLAFDAARQLLMIGLDDALLVLDVAAGAFVFTGAAGVAGIDDLNYDAAAGLVFLSGGAGKHAGISVFSVPAPGSTAFKRVGVVTPAGKNAIIDAAARKLYTTVPHNATSGKAAYVQVFSY